jgi:hypothetical protein
LSTAFPETRNVSAAPTESNERRLVRVVEEIGGTAAGAWLRASITAIEAGDEVEALLCDCSAEARRRLGDAELGGRGPLLCAAQTALQTSHWTLADTGRVCLLLAASAAHPEAAAVLAQAVFRNGDEAERVALVRGLALFPAPAALKPIALETGRVNSLYLFRALALRNPYPAVYYEEAELNQLVLKALFNELPITQIVGLEARANRELARMCEDYIAERRAAGRTIPRDIWLALAPEASATGEALMIEHLAHEDRCHRYYSALAILRRSHAVAPLRARLVERLNVERDPAVLEVLRRV